MSLDSSNATDFVWPEQQKQQQKNLASDLWQNMQIESGAAGIGPTQVDAANYNHGRGVLPTLLLVGGIASDSKEIGSRYEPATNPAELSAARHGLPSTEIETKLPLAHFVSMQIVDAPPSDKEQKEENPADLIKDLGSEKFETRKAAQKKLEEKGVEAVPDLVLALKNDDAEIRRRAQEAIDKIRSDINSEARFPEKSFDQTKNETKKGLNNMDLHELAKLNRLKEFDEDHAKDRLRDIEDARKRLDRMNESLKDDGITSEISRLKSLEKDYKNLSARKSDIDKLTEGVTVLGVSGEYSESELRLISRCKNLEVLSARGSRQTDKVLQYANGLDKLTGLNLEESTVTDADLAKLKGSPLEKSLNHLYLDKTSITDDGLKALTNCSELKHLSLKNTFITDSGLEHLASMTSLEGLSLDNSHISGQGLRHLSNLKNLSELSLAGTAISDEDLLHLKDLKNLQNLNLSKTTISNRGLENLLPLQLKYLDLRENKAIDDDGIKPLSAMKTLLCNSIRLDKTSVSPDGIEKLKKTNPEKVYLPD